MLENRLEQVYDVEHCALLHPYFILLSDLTMQHIHTFIQKQPLHISQSLLTKDYCSGASLYFLVESSLLYIVTNLCVQMSCIALDTTNLFQSIFRIVSFPCQGHFPQYVIHACWLYFYIIKLLIVALVFIVSNFMCIFESKWKHVHSTAYSKCFEHIE